MISQQQQQRLRDLRDKVAALLSDFDRGLAPAEFSKQLQSYAYRAHEVLHPSASVSSTLSAPPTSYEWKTYTQDTRVVQFCEAKGLTLPYNKGKLWRWAYDSDKIGTIQGLEKTIRGWPRVTDGVELWIECLDGSVFQAHFDWFVADKVKAERKPKTAKKKVEAAQAVAQDSHLHGEELRQRLLAMLEE